MTDINIGALSEALNDKVDLDLGNMSPTQSAINRVAGWSMPTGNYEDLTLEESGHEYTAPANGWIYFAKGTTVFGQYVSIYIKDTNGNIIIQDYNTVTGTNNTATILAPVKKDQTFSIGYNADGTTVSFRFIYADGDGEGQGGGDQPVIYGGGTVPDYKKGVSKTWGVNNIAEKAGLVIAHDSAQQTTRLKASVNGVTLPFNDIANNGWLSISFFVNKDDVWKVEGGDGTDRVLMFYPLEEADDVEKVVIPTIAGIPNYYAVTQETLPYTATEKCYAVCTVYVYENYANISVNGNLVARFGGSNHQQDSAFIFLDEGDTISATGGTCVLYIYRCKDFDTLGNRYLGTLVKSLLPIEDSSLHLLDGSVLQYSGMYKNFIDHVANLYESGEKKSKIEKIGNLVDNNGIISNFSVSNYGVIPVLNSKLALASSWEIGGKFNVLDFANVPSGGACIFANNFGASSNRSIYIIASIHSSIAVFLSASGGTTWDIADNEDDFNITNLTSNTDYWYRLKYTGSSYVLELSTDGITYSQTKTLNKSAHIYSEDVNLFLGDNHTGSMYFPGSIDLNACYVNIEGQRYWTGREVSWATSELKWQESISSYGSCGKFVYDSVNQTVRLPKVSDIIQGTSDVNALGDLTEAGAPNITGTFNANGISPAISSDGVFTGSYYTTPGETYGGNGISNTTHLLFNASNSNNIYGNSDTVQPQTIKALYYMVVATGSREEVKLNFDAKADKDLGNLSNEAKNILINLFTPDYSRGVAVNGKVGYTATTAGVVILFLDTAENNDWTYVYCNGSPVAMAHGKGGRSNGDGTAFVPVVAGDVITAGSNFNSASGYFYPYKGV